MRHLAASLLTTLLLHLNSLQAQDDNLLAASFYGFDDLFTGDHRDDRSRYLTSDSNLIDFNWDFAEWDNRTFNPYKEQDLQTPFFISIPDHIYASPVGARKVITSHYGWRDGILHRGIDLDLVTGDQVYAIFEGKVRYVRSHAGHGKTVVIRHANGLETVYAHLSKQLVEENQIVKKGDPIGKGGTTGNARGSHLHLEVRYEGVTINPEYFFDFDSEVVTSGASWITEEISDPRRFSSTKKANFITVHELAQTTASHVETVSVLTPQVQELPAPELPETKPLEAEPKQRPVLQYVIKYGDTLYSLARVHNTTVEDICRVNGIADSFKIKVGQRLILDY